MQELILTHRSSLANNQASQGSKEAATLRDFEARVAECGPLAFRVARGVLRNAATLSFNAMRTPDMFNPWAKMRTGTRVPVSTGKDQMTYIDVGTNIDSRAVRTDDGRYSVQLNIERSWVDSDVAVPQNSANPSSANSSASPCQPREPVIRQFKSEFNNTVREGETVESTLATDPLSGKVTKVQITLTTVK